MMSQILISFHETPEGFSLATNLFSESALQIVNVPLDHPNRDMLRAELIEQAIFYLRWKQSPMRDRSLLDFIGSESQPKTHVAPVKDN